MGRAPDWRERLALETLACLAENASHEETIRAILTRLHAATGLAQTGLRLRDGDDFPFHLYHGYSEEFLHEEASLIARGEDGAACLDEEGRPRLDCLCGRVLRGRTDPSLGCFTPGGSFFTSSWSALAPLAKELGFTRGRCLMVGSETQALVPLRRGAVRIGLLHLADPRSDQLTLEEVAFLEGLGAAIAVAFEEISERRRADSELAASRAELRRLSHALEDALEGERARLARALHDELGAGLVGIKMDARWIDDHLAKDADPALRRCARSLAESADALGAISRRITTDLRPPILDHMGLPAAIDWLASGLERRTGIRCRLALPAELPLEKDRATALFRAVQEGLTNVARHAGASEVSIQLARVGRRIRLEIHDDGRGFGEPSGDGLGLAGMRERIERRGGSLAVTSGPGRGTRLEIELPVGEELLALTDDR